MHITLIKPNMGRMMHGAYVDEGRMEPLQIGILAALTPQAHDVVFYDDRMEDIPFDCATDLVAITVETFTAKRSYEIAAAYRRRGVTVVLGGMHVTLLPTEARAHADAIVTGDAESIWQTLLDDVERGQLQPVYCGRTMGEPQRGIVPRRDLFKGKGYLPISLMQFSRGCPNHCHFCASSVYFKQCHYCRSVQAVVDEIVGQGLKLIFFVDDNLVADVARAKQLFRALIPLKIKWVSQASISMTADRELMSLMMQSGCLGNVIGFESIDPITLQQMNKLVNIGDRVNERPYQSEIEILRHYGHQTWAAFTIGHDGDTPESIQATYDFAIANKFAFAAFNVLMPYPGTPLYDDLRIAGRLLYDNCWWLHDDFRFNHAPFRPANMTAAQLTELGFRCRKNFNSLRSIAYRALDIKTNMRSLYRLGVYLTYNPLFRREVFKKQSMRLGEQS